ncbi:unnamed protein product [Arabis nemorensis]|uniref:Uncharacterized protein n=1 Tax=Arabis nemorensis TaxID=586526 RepID=A0A565BH48_9BRAS|nr:unnamed protein product [Arabis nemorensis]
MGEEILQRSLDACSSSSSQDFIKRRSFNHRSRSFLVQNYLESVLCISLPSMKKSGPLCVKVNDLVYVADIVYNIKQILVMEKKNLGNCQWYLTVRTQYVLVHQSFDV